MLNQRVFRYLQQDYKVPVRKYWVSVVISLVFTVSILVFWAHKRAEGIAENSRDIHSANEISEWYEEYTATKISEVSEAQFVDVTSIPEIYNGIVPVDITKLDSYNMLTAVLRPEISMRYIDKDYLGSDISNTSVFEIQVNGMTAVGTTLQGNVENIKVQIPMQDELLQYANEFYDMMLSADSGYQLLKTREYGGVKLLIAQKESTVYGIQIDEFQKTITVSRGLEQ